MKSIHVNTTAGQCQWAKSMEPRPPLPFPALTFTSPLIYYIPIDVDHLLHIPIDKIQLYLAFSSIFSPKSIVFIPFFSNLTVCHFGDGGSRHGGLSNSVDFGQNIEEKAG